MALRLAEADAFVIVTPEYNRGYPASLKFAIDSAREEWFAKPVCFVSYGGMSGGLRSVEQLRLVCAELHMVTLRDCVSLHSPSPRMVPSAEAEELFSQTSAIFAAQKEIRDRIEEIRANQERPVTISATPALVEGFLAPRLARAGYRSWARTLRLWVGESDDDVRQGRADIGLQMALPPRADLIVETLCDVALVAVMQASHPLARKSARVIPDFKGQALVSFDPDWSPIGAAIRRAFVAHGLEHRLACQVPFSSTVCHMVSACGGIGTIDAITAQSALTTSLVVRPIQSIPPLPLRAFHRRDKPLTARTQELLLALKGL